jgi:hypothetical protein
MPQTVYNLDMAQQIAGLIVERGTYNGRFSTSEAVPPGRFLELASGSLRLPQGTTLTAPIGVTPYFSHLPAQTDGTNNLYRSGDNPALLRKGQIWVEYAGTAPSVGASVNIMHSSTTATNRGKVTASATSATAGSEISAVEGLKCMAVDTAGGLALVELNLPA